MMRGVEFFGLVRRDHKIAKGILDKLAPNDGGGIAALMELAFGVEDRKSVV